MSLRLARIVWMIMCAAACPAFALAQTMVPAADTTVPQVDLPEVLFPRKVQQKDAKAATDDRRNFNLALLPVVGYMPANGFLFGAAVSAATTFGNDGRTRQSSALVNAQYTTKKQIMIIGRSSVALKQNDWLLDGDVRLLIFTQDTYGLGIKAGKAGESDYAMPQNQDFNYLRMYGTAFRRISGKLYASAGVEIDGYTKIKDEVLESGMPGSSYFYQYNQSNAHSLTSNRISGITTGLRWDSRDNVSNPYRGWLASFHTRFNQEWLGSQARGVQLMTEARAYINVDKRRPQHLLAFWYRGIYSKEGKLPYLTLPSIGWDAYNRTGRGYIQGRFRGPSLFYFESEYRFPLTRNGLLGGVAFTNITSASGNGMKLFQRFAPATGAGLRVKFNKESRTNITVDYARGLGGSSGFFFSLQEAF